MSPHKLVTFGLDNAGKTSLINYIKDDKILDDPFPTKEFNVLDVVINDIEIVMWDAPGQVDYRTKWKKGAVNTSLLLFIIDTAADSRFEEVKSELDRILNELGTEGVPLLVCFHKMDLLDTQHTFKKAMETLKLSEIKDRYVYWAKTSIYSGDGIKEFKEMIYQYLVILEAKSHLQACQDKF